MQPISIPLKWARKLENGAGDYIVREQYIFGKGGAAAAGHVHGLPSS